MSWSEIDGGSVRVRLAVMEPSDGSFAQGLSVASMPGIEIVASGPLAALVQSVHFPADVVLIVGDSDEPDETLARVGVCRCLGTAVVVVQDGVSPFFRRRLQEAGVEEVVDREEAVVHLLARATPGRTERAVRRSRKPVCLSPAESRAVALFTAGASRREVARELGVTVETVKTLLGRARRKDQVDRHSIAWVGAT